MTLKVGLRGDAQVTWTKDAPQTAGPGMTSQGRTGKLMFRPSKVCTFSGPEVQLLGVSHKEIIEMVHEDLTVRKLSAVLITA